MKTVSVALIRWGDSPSYLKRAEGVETVYLSIPDAVDTTTALNAFFWRVKRTERKESNYHNKHLHGDEDCG